MTVNVSDEVYAAIETKRNQAQTDADWCDSQVLTFTADGDHNKALVTNYDLVLADLTHDEE